MGRASAEPVGVRRPNLREVGKRTTINVQNLEGLPLSDAVRFGDLLFVSGMVGMDEGSVVEGGIAAETRQAFRNIAEVLAAAGATLSDVLKVNVILTARRILPPSTPPIARSFRPIRRPASPWWRTDDRRPGRDRRGRRGI